ncbi:hypothetical protein [Burkholderia multivorans]|uniref:hypothetical protein n=1 Tax=Burkholderia multivorans TaxID=87883 RepID=UPI00143E8AB5|nr:hypothetical protein [Burkholderia multivorans]QIX17335.1 hypothetical protein FOB32_17210 [Burkholderia multivorans]
MKVINKFVSHFTEQESYETRIERHPTGFVLSQETNGYHEPDEDRVALGESAARAVYLTLKAHFEP